MDAKLIVCSCSQDVADQITTKSIKNRLASHIYELPAWSHYLWGSPPTESEVTLVMITRSDLSDELYETILEIYPSELPTIVSLPINDVHKPYVKLMTRYLAR